MEKRRTRSAGGRAAGEEGCVWSRCALRAESARLLSAARRRQSRVQGLAAFPSASYASQALLIRVGTGAHQLGQQ